MLSTRLTVTLLLRFAWHVNQPLELQVPPPVEEETNGVMKQDEDLDVEMEDHLNIQQVCVCVCMCACVCSHFFYLLFFCSLNHLIVLCFWIRSW